MNATLSSAGVARDVVIYDGECRFCSRQIARIRWLDRAGRLEFISLHDPQVAAQYPDLTHEQLMSEMAIVTADGERYWGASALQYLTRKLPTLWWLAPLLHIPLSMPIWSWLYRQVARRRYLFGRLEACEGGACKL